MWNEDDEDDFGYEQDIADHQYTVPGDITRTVNIQLSFSEDVEFRWIKNIVAECTCDGVVVATASARYIRRERMRSAFWEGMEEPSQDTCDVAFEVFDRYGTVKAKYKDHPVQRGTGVWGNELDNGPLFLIEELHVTAPELRRRGLGQKIVSLLLGEGKNLCLEEKMDDEYAVRFYSSREAFERDWTLHGLVSPGHLTADVESLSMGKPAEERLKIRARAESGAIHFWRACGFRRIGASGCFGFSFDPEHKSRALPADSDFDPREDHADDVEDEKLRETGPFIDIKKLKVEKLRETLPLHHAAFTLADRELKDYFVAHADDKFGRDQVTTSESTLLHITARKLKPLSTRWLLENVQHADTWKTTRDIHGYTPLEALQESLETMRTKKDFGSMVLNVSDEFRGYPETIVSCLSLLSGRDTSGLDGACLRYGCTCGECLGGFLSARMRSALIFQGEAKDEFNRQIIGDGGYWIMRAGNSLKHVDRDVLRSLGTNRSLRNGFVNMFQLVVECLRAKKVPTVENIEQSCDNNQSEGAPDTKNYLQCAGTQMGCWAVLRLMFDAAKAEDEKIGNGGYRLGMKGKPSDLPTCRNDLEFEFVARACGYGRDDFFSRAW